MNTCRALLVTCASLGFMPATASAYDKDLALGIAMLLAAEQECRDIDLDPGKIERVVANEAARDERFAQFVFGGGFDGAVLRFRNAPSAERIAECDTWRRTAERHGYIR